jgi:polar amino acid transport system substrate-binding protein
VTAAGRLVAAAAAGCAAAAVLAGCTSSGSTPQAAATGPGPTTSATPAAPSTAPSCDARASLRPAGPLPAPGQFPAGSFMATIRKRGRLLVGTSQDTQLFSARNPFTGTIEGFDIDMARQVAGAIFGDPTKIQIVTIPNSQRIDAVTSGRVDLVAETMTITCARLLQVAFSTEYYRAGQKVLVPTDSPARGIDNLGGKRVCATAGSTSLARLRTLSVHVTPVTATTQAECLVLFQEGSVDAISTDDTILAGLATQDPYAKIVGPAFSDEPYGLAVSLGHPEFTRFVNAVLERVRQDGTWTRLYRTWLSRLGPPPAPPPARYRD